jgi:cyanophycinase
MGGGSDVDASFQRVASGISGGDVVVIRTSGSNGYNDYLDGLMSPDSVETLLLDNRTKADSAYADWVIRSAEFLFIAGGDQSDYLNQWQGTLTQSAIQHVYDKGGFVGGTSAGHAVMSEGIYDPDGILSVYSDEAVTDACHPYIHLSTGFLQLPHMQNVVNDSHFAERDRMGRLLTFMAILGESSIAPTLQPITGIGIDEATAMLVDASGYGIVDGSGSVYVLREGSSTARIQVACGQAVRYEGVERYRVGNGGYFDLATGQSSASPTLIGIDGRYGSFYLPSNPY